MSKVAGPLIPSKLPTFQVVVILAICPLGKMYKHNKITNLISKLNFYKLIIYLMDKRGPPNQPRYQLTKGLSRFRQEKDAMM